MKQAAVFLSTLIVGTLAQTTNRCGENEQWTDCYNECQQANCTYTPDICTEECQGSACICAEGFVRGPGGDCISPDECPDGSTGSGSDGSSTPGDWECGPNQHFTDCYNECRQANCTYTPDVCPLICDGRGCECNEDYVRGPYGACVLPEECPEEQ